MDALDRCRCDLCTAGRRLSHTPSTVDEFTYRGRVASGGAHTGTAVLDDTDMERSSSEMVVVVVVVVVWSWWW